MIELFKSALKTTPLYLALRRHRFRRELILWEKGGRPDPLPHLAKIDLLKRYAEEYNLRTFVETGTFRGDMIHAMKDRFDELFSIELSEEFARAAQQRFRRLQNVHIIQGDSGSRLVHVINKLRGPALFWLDGHYSGGQTARGTKETPIVEELNVIFDAEDFGHVVVIDDARLFGTDPAYPSIEQTREFVLNKRDNIRFLVSNDSIQIVPAD